MFLCKQVSFPGLLEIIQIGPYRYVCVNDVFLAIGLDEAARELVDGGGQDLHAGVRPREGLLQRPDLLLQHSQASHLSPIPGRVLSLKLNRADAKSPALRSTTFGDGLGWLAEDRRSQSAELSRRGASSGARLTMITFGIGPRVGAYTCLTSA